MAWPLVAALALAAGSAYANNRQVRAQEDARRQAQQAQLLRQSRLQQEADSRNTDVQDQFERENVEQQMQELAGREEDRASAAIEEGAEKFSPTDALTQDTPAVIRDAGDRAKAKSLAEAMRNARSMSALQGYGLAGFENDMALNRNATHLSNLGNFAQGNQGIFRAEMEDAQSAGRGWGSLGQVLGAASMAVGGYGAMAGGAAGAGASAAGQAGTAPIGYGAGFGAAANTGTYTGALGNAAAAASMQQPSGLAALFGNMQAYQPLLALQQRQR